MSGLISCWNQERKLLNAASIGLFLLVFLVLFNSGSGMENGAPPFHSEIENLKDQKRFVVFSENGGWCWFQDERAIVNNGKLLIGAVTSNLVGSDRGDIDLTVYDFESQVIESVTLHEGFQRNDHNAPAFMLRSDGRYLAVYSKHHTEELIRYRISKAPEDPINWGPERSISTTTRTTYSNVYYLEQEGVTYNFYRQGERPRTPHFVLSEDDGSTWTSGGQLLASDNIGHWPYIRYASNGVDEIHFVTSDAHPNQYEENSLYHGFLRDGKIHRSDGTVVGSLNTNGESAIRASDLSLIFKGSAEEIPWASDIRLDREGRPYIGYSVARDRNGYDHRYRYARWDGSVWRDWEIAHAGSMLYKAQNFYTGLITLHPDTPNAIFISTDVNPETGTPLKGADGERRYELFIGVTSNGGASWRWRALTENSCADNIRPIVASDGSDWALLWMRGTYHTYRNYQTQVVGIVSRTGWRDRDDGGLDSELSTPGGL